MIEVEVNMKFAPYKGDEKYIFISYAHKDKDLVFPIIKNLNKENYRVWYDEGIDPGTEWDENIAYHIKQAEYFIAFISKAYLESDNCKDELNLARDLKNERLLIYLEEVELPLGMKMRLDRLQAIFRYTYENDEDFFTKLYSTRWLEQFKNSDLLEKKIESKDVNNEYLLSKEEIEKREYVNQISIHKSNDIQKECSKLVKTSVDKMNEMNSIFKFKLYDKLKDTEKNILREKVYLSGVNERPKYMCTFEKSLTEGACVLTDSHMVMYRSGKYRQNYFVLPLSMLLKFTEEWDGAITLYFMDNTKEKITENEFKGLLVKFLYIFLEKSINANEYRKRVLFETIENTNVKAKNLKIVRSESNAFAKISINGKEDIIYFDSKYIYGFGISNKINLSDIKTVSEGEYPGWIEIVMRNNTNIDLTFGLDYTADMYIFFQEYLENNKKMFK